ncbi:hypothetical protein [Magnetospirillum sp. SS-4]|uniref:hypothetical protein n=1 Tax=Magnetospirillum sp. SS-4 TaxID=2681465 RepID=UPI001384DEB0|nr:hypothetical protein [Magnetospirillum sp. SS-4]CAA7622041.1 Histone H1 [Magnetospirillum sp. SS-4]
MSDETKVKANDSVPVPAPGAKAARAAKPAARKAAAPAAPEEVVAAAEPVREDGAVGVKAARKEKEKKKDKKERKKDKKDKKEKKNKEAVIIRFDDAQLPQIDAQAEALGLSRAAWVRMVVAKALAKASSGVNS